MLFVVLEVPVAGSYALAFHAFAIASVFVPLAATATWAVESLEAKVQTDSPVFRLITTLYVPAMVGVYFWDVAPGIFVSPTYHWYDTSEAAAAGVTSAVSSLPTNALLASAVFVPTLSAIFTPAATAFVVLIVIVFPFASVETLNLTPETGVTTTLSL